MTEADNYEFRTEAGKKYYEWLNSLSPTTFKAVFIEEWNKMLERFGKGHIVKNVHEAEKDGDKIWN